MSLRQVPSKPSLPQAGGWLYGTRDPYCSGSVLGSASHVAQFPLTQIRLFSLLHAAFTDAVEGSPKLELTHQAALLLMKLLPVNLSLQNKWLLTIWQGCVVAPHSPCAVVTGQDRTGH